MRYLFSFTLRMEKSAMNPFYQHIDKKLTLLNPTYGRSKSPWVQDIKHLQVNSLIVGILLQ